jgi:hypothetical protein
MEKTHKWPWVPIKSYIKNRYLARCGPGVGVFQPLVVVKNNVKCQLKARVLESGLHSHFPLLTV